MDRGGSFRRLFGEFNQAVKKNVPGTKNKQDLAWQRVCRFTHLWSVEGQCENVGMVGLRLNLPLVPVLSWCCGIVGGSQWADVLVFVTVKNA